MLSASIKRASTWVWASASSKYSSPVWLPLSMVMRNAQYAAPAGASLLLLINVQVSGVQVMGSKLM